MADLSNRQLGAQSRTRQVAGGMHKNRRILLVLSPFHFTRLLVLTSATVYCCIFASVSLPGALRCHSLVSLRDSLSRTLFCHILEKSRSHHRQSDSKCVISQLFSRMSTIHRIPDSASPVRDRPPSCFSAPLVTIESSLALSGNNHSFPQAAC